MGFLKYRESLSPMHVHIHTQIFLGSITQFSSGRMRCAPNVFSREHSYSEVQAWKPCQMSADELRTY